VIFIRFVIFPYTF